MLKLIPDYFPRLNIKHNTKNLYLILLNKGKEGAPVVFYGDGHTIRIDTNGVLLETDPLYEPPQTIHGYGDCTVYGVWFPYTCSGLSAAADQLAKFINDKVPEGAEVVLHGHSKCGCMFIHAAKSITRRCTIVSVSAPLHGTPIADLENFGSKLKWPINKLYRMIFSDHNVDRDICPGSEFIKGLDLKSASENHDLYIVTSSCGFSLNPVDWILGLVDKFLGIKGDGVVPIEAQYPTGTRFTQKSATPLMDGVKLRTLTASHATSLRRSRRFIPQLRSKRTRVHLS